MYARSLERSNQLRSPRHLVVCDLLANFYITEATRRDGARVCIVKGDPRDVCKPVMCSVTW